MSTRRAASALRTAPARVPGPVLTVDLDALAANYRRLSEVAAPVECAAVVKADGYGLGAGPVTHRLRAEGCRTFFVATPEEAAALRAAAPDIVLYVLDGLLPGTASLLADLRARPVLGSLAEIEEWGTFCAERRERLPAALHLDTGMNRLGLPAREVEALAASAGLLEAFEPVLVMSHLACADEPQNARNAAQRARFDRLRGMLPPLPASLANSAGVLLGGDYHYDLVRPGIALYGGNPLAGGANPMRSVVRLEAPILQVRDAAPGDGVGYGAAQTLRRRTRIATVALGYADGYFRLAGSRDEHPGAVAYIDGHAAPLLGRVSMDLITIDVTDIPAGRVRRGAMVEFLGPHVPVDELARHARTIGYEVLTRLGPRCRRVYEGG